MFSGAVTWEHASRVDLRKSYLWELELERDIVNFLVEISTFRFILDRYKVFILRCVLCRWMWKCGTGNEKNIRSDVLGANNKSPRLKNSVRMPVYVRRGRRLFSSFLITIKRQDWSHVLHVADICGWKYELRNSFVITVIQHYDGAGWCTVSLCVMKLLVVDCVFGTGIHW
jgi:hypothetical protein